jgi:hypothetical protein
MIQPQEQVNSIFLIIYQYNLNMKRTLLLLVLVTSLTHFSSKAQMVLGSESFDNQQFVPTAWSLKAVVGAANPQAMWVRSTTSTNPSVNPHSGAAMARFRSRSGLAGSKQQMSTRPIDYTNRGTNVANVHFWMYRDDLNTNYDSVTVYVNNADSIDANAVKLGTVARNRTYAMPDTQAINDWYEYTFTVPLTFSGNNTTHFIFEGNCENVIGANQGANTTIDDISFEEFPTPCTGTPNVGVIVNPIPTLCGGAGTANLTLSQPINNAAGLTYNWLASASASGPWVSFGINSASTVTNVLTAKTYFKCQVTCSNSGLIYSTSIDSINVSTSPLPTISISPSPAAFCAGSAGVMISGAGATSYVWSPATGLSATTGLTVTATPAANTQYTVVGTDSNGCASSATVNVTLANAPIIAFTTNPTGTSFCAGTQIIINPIQGGGPGAQNQYQWSDGKTTRRDTTIINTTTTLSVIVTNQAGCSATDSITITALSAQSSGFKYVQNGNTFVFTDTTTGSTNWSWDFGDGNLSNAQNPTYTYSTPGTYNVTMIVTGPCKTDTITRQITIFPLDIPKIVSTNALNYCYPNPASNELNIMLGDEKIESISIQNVLGQTIQSIHFGGKNQLEKISIAVLSNGLYSIQARGNKQQSAMKFLKK